MYEGVVGRESQRIEGRVRQIFQSTFPRRQKGVWISILALTTHESNHTFNAEVQGYRGRSSMCLDHVYAHLTDYVINRKPLKRKRKV